MSKKYNNLKILHLILEFPTWKRSRSWSYSAQLSLDEGLRNIGVDCFSVNTMCISSLKKLCANRKFDQVWLEIVHQPLDDELLEWLAALAPVRIGFLFESLEYSEEHCRLYPHLRERKKLISSRFKYLTHIMTIDEHDSSSLDPVHKIQAAWLFSSIPERLISTEASENFRPVAFFGGSIYGARKDWLENPELKGLLARQPSAEAWTPYPLMYNGLQFSISQYNRFIGLKDGKLLAAYTNTWFMLRKKCFSRWIEKLKFGCAVVNLPSAVRAYAGRVVEGMAAGVPVISWRIPDRPLTEQLFEDGKEILLYPADDSSLFAAHVKKLIQDKAFSRKIATNALKKVKSFHTAEHRVKEILEWVESGVEPSY